MYFDFLYNICLKHFSFQEEFRKVVSQMYTGLHVRYLLFLSDFIETWIFSWIFERYSKIKSHENPSSGSRVVPCGHTDMMKLIITFCNFVNVPTLQLERRTFVPNLMKHCWRGHGIPNEDNQTNSCNATSQHKEDVMQDRKDLTVIKRPPLLSKWHVISGNFKFFFVCPLF